MNDPHKDNGDSSAEGGRSHTGRGPGYSESASGDRDHPSWQPFDPYMLAPAKRKWIAGLLSCCIPGTGHFYLGLMQKGLLIMLLIIMDIFAIVHFSLNMSSIPLITLLALFLPIIYFYSLFDALQSTERLNAYRFTAAAKPGGPAVLDGQPQPPGSRPYIGWLLVGAGALFFVVSAKPAWMNAIMDKMGTLIGGLVLIGIGIVLFLRNARSK